MKRKLTLSLENLKALTSAATVVGGTDDSAGKEAANPKSGAFCLTPQTTGV